MTEFTYAVGAAVALLVVGGVIAGFVAEGGVGSGAGPGEPIFHEDFGPLGGEETTSRTVLTASDLLVEAQSPNRTVAERDAVSVGSSVLGGETEVIEFQASNPQQVFISFIPSRLGPLSNLRIRLNGEPLDIADLETGRRVTLPSEDLRAGSNVVEVAATSPSWLGFWKRPSYRLTELDVVLSDATFSSVVEPFRARDYEVRGFDKGVIRYSVTEDTVRDEPLVLRINGNPVSERLPIKRASDYETAFFANTSGLHAGENTLMLSTKGDSTYPLSSLSIDLFYFAGDKQRTVTRSFDLSQGQYDAIGSDGGRITFKVTQRPLPRPLKISLTNRTFTTTPSPGLNTVAFGQDAVVTGSNDLTVSTDGAYTLENFNISVSAQ